MSRFSYSSPHPSNTPYRYDQRDNRESRDYRDDREKRDDRNRDSRDFRDNRDYRDDRDKNSRDSRDYRDERDIRDTRGDARDDIRYARDVREYRDERDDRDSRDNRVDRDFRDDRDSRDYRDDRDSRDFRDTRSDTRDYRDSRDTRDTRSDTSNNSYNHSQTPRVSDSRPTPFPARNIQPSRPSLSRTSLSARPLTIPDINREVYTPITRTFPPPTTSIPCIPLISASSTLTSVVKSTPLTKLSKKQVLESSSSDEAPPKKRRGRPPGSKNRPVVLKDTSPEPKKKVKSAEVKEVKTIKEVVKVKEVVKEEDEVVDQGVVMDETSVPPQDVNMDDDTTEKIESGQASMSLPNRRRPILLSQINTPDRSGRTPLFKFLSYPPTTLLLLENGASPLIKDNAGYTPLHEACVQGEVEGARLVLMYGADVNACGGDSDTPLHDASISQNISLVSLLLHHGANPNLPNKHHQTPLSLATPQIQSLINTHIASLNTAHTLHSNNTTTLHLAALKGDTDECKKLLEFGVDVNVVNDDNETALFAAVTSNNSSTVALLLQYGADPKISSSSPLSLALSTQNESIITLLLQYNATPPSNIPPTLLHLFTSPDIILPEFTCIPLSSLSRQKYIPCTQPNLTPYTQPPPPSLPRISLPLTREERALQATLNSIKIMEGGEDKPFYFIPKPIDVEKIEAGVTVKRAYKRRSVVKEEEEVIKVDKRTKAERDKKKEALRELEMMNEEKNEEQQTIFSFDTPQSLHLLLLPEPHILSLDLALSLSHLSPRALPSSLSLTPLPVNLVQSLQTSSLPQSLLQKLRSLTLPHLQRFIPIYPDTLSLEGLNLKEVELHLIPFSDVKAVYENWEAQTYSSLDLSVTVSPSHADKSALSNGSHDAPVLAQTPLATTLPTPSDIPSSDLAASTSNIPDPSQAPQKRFVSKMKKLRP